MYKIKSKELKQLFAAIKVEDLIDLDSLKKSVDYESVIKIGTVEIDVNVFVLLYEDEAIDLDRIILDFKVFDEGKEIPYKLANEGEYIYHFEKLEDEIKAEIKNKIN
jgi:hypothetical protein